MPRHHGMIRPGIRFVAAATISGAELPFTGLGLQAEDLVHYSIGRTVATAPSLPDGWSEIIPAWSDPAPAYCVHWWKFYRPGDADPSPAESGRKRLRVYRGARIKTGSAVTAVNVGTAMSIPARSCIKDVLREWAVYSLYCRNAQADIGTWLPDGATRRFANAPAANNGTGGDTGGLNTGLPQLDFTLSAASPAVALAYVLEPRNS